MAEANFAFYGIKLHLNSDSDKLIRDILRDYSFFTSDINQPKLTINGHLMSPPYQTLPPLIASYTSPRNTCYYHKGIKYIDYSGRALAIYNSKKQECDIYSADYSQLHEICHMAILSLVSEELGKINIHLIHALGFEFKDKKAVLLPMDMGGGKTTLAMKLLAADTKIKLISDDSPLINKKGEILPFPIRFVIDGKDMPQDVPGEYLRYSEGHEFGPKVLIDMDYFKGKISKQPSEPQIIILSKRVLGRKSQIVPASRYAALREFVKHSVIGVGLFQGIEYIFQKGLKEVFLKIPLGLSRLSNALRVISKSKIFTFYMEQDTEENVSLLLSFLQKYTSTTL